MKQLFIIAVLLTSIPANAQHSVPSRLVRLAEHTARNMATVRDPEAFAAQWGTVRGRRIRLLYAAAGINPMNTCTLRS